MKGKDPLNHFGNLHGLFDWIENETESHYNSCFISIRPYLSRTVSLNYAQGQLWRKRQSDSARKYLKGAPLRLERRFSLIENVKIHKLAKKGARCQNPASKCQTF